MIIAADHVSNLHKRIVDYHRIIVRRQPVRPDQNEIADYVTGKFHFTVYNIPESNRPGPYFQSNHRGPTLIKVSFDFRLRKELASPWILPGHTGLLSPVCL